MRSNTLILLCKYPTPSNVKTRLGKSIGMDVAAEFQCRCLHKLIDTHRTQRNYQLLIGLRENTMVDCFATEFNMSHSQIFVQQGDDLGQVKHHALQYGLSMSKHVCLIGSDAPILTDGQISRAFQHLQHHDVVIGPSQDGGYYLLGSSTGLQDIVVGMTYSTDTVYQETTDRLQQYGYMSQTLKTLIDIDTLEALGDAVVADTTGRFSEVITDLQIDMDG